METVKAWFLLLRTYAHDSARELVGDQSGAAMVEYSILIGLIAAAIVVAVGLVGTWMLGEWQGLCTALGIAGC